MNLDKLFQFVLEATSKYGSFFTIMVLLLIFIIVICDKTRIILWITDKTDEYREQKHLKGLRERKEKTNLINARLAQILIDTNSDRAVVFEYHNNGSNMAGLPFIHVSAHAEAMAPCLSSISQNFQNMPATCFINIINNFDSHSAIYINDIEQECEKQPVLCEYFHAFKAQQLILLPIQGVNNQIGFVVIARNKKQDLTSEDKAAMFSATQAISSILDYENINTIIKKK